MHRSRRILIPLAIVFATVDPGQGRDGITAFLVETDQPGFSVGKVEKKLGIRSSPTVEILLEDLARIRDVESGPEGAIYLLLEHGSGGQIVRLVPADRST